MGRARVAAKFWSRDLVEASLVRLPSGEIAATISAGCASLAETAAETPSALLTAADRRLYAAKKAGRNRVVSSDPAGGPAQRESITSPPSRT